MLVVRTPTLAREGAISAALWERPTRAAAQSEARSLVTAVTVVLEQQAHDVRERAASVLDESCRCYKYLH